jgi:hypothetical protein
MDVHSKKKGTDKIFFFKRELMKYLLYHVLTSGSFFKLYMHGTHPVANNKTYVGLLAILYQTNLG